MYGYIYLTTNLKNNKKYIGQKKGKFNCNYLGSGLILKQAVKLYGKENFTIEIIDYAKDAVQLDDLEKYHIKINNACEREDFYNIHEGGNGGNTKAGYTDEQILEFGKKVSQSKSGSKLNLTVEQRKKKSERMSGKNNPMYGKSAMKGRPVSKETREKLSTSNKGKNLGKKLTNKTRENISNTLLEHYSKAENREKCSRKDEENGMATPCRVIFPWGEEKEFTMLKTLYKYLEDNYKLSFYKSQNIYLSGKPWNKVLKKEFRYLSGLKIEKINK